MKEASRGHWLSSAVLLTLAIVLTATVAGPSMSATATAPAATSGLKHPKLCKALLSPKQLRTAVSGYKTSPIHVRGYPSPCRPSLRLGTVSQKVRGGAALIFAYSLKGVTNGVAGFKAPGIGAHTWTMIHSKPRPSNQFGALPPGLIPCWSASNLGQSPVKCLYPRNRTVTWGKPDKLATRYATRGLYVTTHADTKNGAKRLLEMQIRRLKRTL